MRRLSHSQKEPGHRKTQPAVTHIGEHRVRVNEPSEDTRASKRKKREQKARKSTGVTSSKSHSLTSWSAPPVANPLLSGLSHNQTTYMRERERERERERRQRGERESVAATGYRWSTRVQCALQPFAEAKQRRCPIIPNDPKTNKQKNKQKKKTRNEGKDFVN